MINFKEIINTSKLYNFHSHTQFCDGRDEMEVFVKEAIHLNFTDIGFSPHSPIPYFSPCNMKEGDVPSYLAEVKRLQVEYGDKINIYSSMEIDFMDDWGPSSSYFKKLELDYKIGSIHFIKSFVNTEEYVDVDGSFENFKKKMVCHFNDDIKTVVETFYNQTLKMIDVGGFDIIGHFDKIGFNANLYQNGIEDENWYQKIINKVIEAIIDKNIIVEINTKAYEQYNRFFPNERYFQLLKRYNAPVLINSDVHYPERINSGRIEAIKSYYCN